MCVDVSIINPFVSTSLCPANLTIKERIASNNHRVIMTREISRFPNRSSSPGKSRIKWRANYLKFAYKTMAPDYSYDWPIKRRSNERIKKIRGGNGVGWGDCTASGSVYHQLLYGAISISQQAWLEKKSNRKRQRKLEITLRQGYGECPHATWAWSTCA